MYHVTCSFLLLEYSCFIRFRQSSRVLIRNHPVHPFIIANALKQRVPLFPIAGEARHGGQTSTNMGNPVNPGS